MIFAGIYPKLGELHILQTNVLTIFVIVFTYFDTDITKEDYNQKFCIEIQYRKVDIIIFAKVRVLTVTNIPSLFGKRNVIPGKSSVVISILNGLHTLQHYLFSLGLECRFFIGLIAPRHFRPNLYVRHANFNVRQYGGIIIQYL